MSVKKNTVQNSGIDKKTIEQLACLEVNNLILQPPFHLSSNIQWNDKGLSFDGDIEVYSNHHIKKSNFIDKVLVQVKGTTTFKKINKKNKIRHLVDRKDIEVYYKHGKGVLYIIVTINPKTYEKQAYYRILAPLDLKSLISQLNTTGKDSVTLSFKKLENNGLESICKTVVNVVKKQPQHYIEASQKTEIKDFKLSFVDIKENSFDFFEENAYVYGSIGDIDIPLDIAKIREIRSENNEVVQLEGKEINIIYELRETEGSIKIIIENTLTFEANKKTKFGNFQLGKFKTLRSYVKCLQLLNYYIEHGNLPFQSLRFKGQMNKKEIFKGIKEDIKWFNELIGVCDKIGIKENYVFNDEENFPSLFNGILDIFKNERYDLLDIYKQEKMEDCTLCNIRLSKYVKVKLMCVNNNFINFYTEEALTRIGAFIPKYKRKGNGTLDKIPDDWEQDLYKVSIYVTQNMEEMVKDTNFDFDLVKLSFTDKYHDIKADLTINVSLNYINYYDKSCEEKYLELAYELNRRYLTKFPENDIAKVNIYIIKLKQHDKLTGEEQEVILDIQERAEINKDQRIRFACKVLLRSKLEARRIFSSLDVEMQSEMKDYPIYHLYENLE